MDGIKHTFADRKARFEFAPVPEKYLAEGINSAVLVTGWTEGAVLTVPAAGKGEPKVLGCKDRVFDASIPVAHTYADGKVTFTVTPELVGTRILIVF